MGTVFKKTFTKPLPAGAKIIVRNGERLAQWKDAKGKSRSESVIVGKDGTDRVLVTAGTFTAKYRDGSGLVREVATGCRDEAAARSLLTDLERRAEKVRGKILTAGEAAAIDHQETSLAQQIDAYLMKLESEGTSPVHRGNVRRNLECIAADCRFGRLSDLAREPLERWLVLQQKVGMGARTRNTYRAAVVAFCNWCIETGRLLANPFTKVAKANEDIDPRRQRRALTEDELRRLLDVARRRPLLDMMTVRRGKHAGEAVAKLSDKTRRRLETLGWERALIYKTLVLTGLRKGELASLTVGQLVLNGPMPCLMLDAADEKNRDGSTIPLRADLADDLRQWIADKAKASQEAASNAPAVAFDRKHQVPQKLHRGESGGHGEQTCLRLPAVDKMLPPNTPLFIVPAGLIRILDRDLVAAGIARMVQVGPNKWKIDKRDERNRTVDVHALRHTFGTLLSKGGVSPRTAQAAMRHSDVNLTMNTYTDPKLLDVAGAMESLPTFPLGAEAAQVERGRNVLSATGTDDSPASPLAPTLAPTSAQRGQLQAIVGQVVRGAGIIAANEESFTIGLPDQELRPLSTVDNGRQNERAKGFEPSTSSLGS